MSTDTPETPTDAFCNHFSRLDKPRFNRLFSRVAAIRAAENGDGDSAYPEVFDYTHHPITVFDQSVTDSNGMPTAVGEDEILDEFDAHRKGNFTVVIEGPVGTGKSELCAYLTAKLRTEHDRPVLRVDKDSDLLTMLSETIPDFYERETGDTLSQSGDLRGLAEGLESNPDVVAGLVLNKGLDILRKDYDIDTGGRKDELEDLILDRLQELVERRHERPDTEEDEREGFRFVTQQDYESGHHDALRVFRHDPVDSDPWELLNDKFWSALLKEFDSPPLNDLLKEVGQAFDTRPVCVFEDFSIAAVQAEKLRNYMERDDEDDNWDFIIAGTTDYTRSLETRTSEDRFKFYQTNEPESNQVDFLDEESVVDFIRPYLAYPKTSDPSLNYNDNGEKKLQSPPSGTICDECNLCSNEFRDLFPFNEIFIQRIYNPGLDEDDRRPRSIITVIRDILEEVYYGPTSVPSSAQGLEEIDPPAVYLTDEVVDQSETIQGLAKWYGEETSRDGTIYYEVDRAFTEAFDVDGIPKRDGQPRGQLDSGIEYTEDAVFIPSADDVETPGGREGGPDGPSGEDGGGEDTVELSPSVDPVEQKYDDLIRIIPAWVKDPASDEYSETRKFMNAGIKSLLAYLTNGFSLWQGTDLGFYVGKGEPFVYKQSSEAPADHQILVDLDQFRESTLRALLKFGIQQEMLRSSEAPDAEQFLAEEGHGTHLSRLADDWQSKVVGQYVTSDNVLYKKAAQRRNYDFDDFIVATYAWLVLLDDPWQDISAETLNERYQESESFSLDPGLKDGLAPLSLDSRENFEAVIKTAPYVEGILGSRLGVTEKALDVPAIRSHLERYTPYDVLDNLAKNPYIDNIPRRIRFNTDDESKLKEMALRMYRLKRTMDDDVLGMHLSVDEEGILRQLRGMSLDDVEEVHQTLTQSYGRQMPSQLKETLDGFVSTTDQNTIEEVVAGAELLQSLGGTTQENVHEYLAELKLQEHSLTQSLAELGEFESTGGTDGFAPTFLEVSRFYE